MTHSDPQARLESIVIAPATSIGEAMARLDCVGTGALAICSEDRKLVGILTDGDIRRAILKARRLEDACGSVCTREPITATHPVASAEALRLMIGRDIDHLPVVDAKGALCDFILRRDLETEAEFAAAAQQRLEAVLIPPDATIAATIAQLDRAGTGALLLASGDRLLRGLLTDGDVRRAILQGKPMDAPCETIASRKPVTIPPATSSTAALALMNQHDINHLPVVGEDHRVVDFLSRKDLGADVHPSLSAVVMAGGYGKRLLPLTETVPKPMLPIGDRPLLEFTLRQLQRSGIRHVSLTTHYLPEAILNHFGDGEGFGVSLNYLQEDNPMGTAGGLRRMNRPDGPLLVLNGDILTGLPFQEMLTYHRLHRGMLTVAVRKYEMQVPFGVVQCDDVRITGLQEKPLVSMFINAGAYLLEPAALEYIPEGRAFDMTDLIQRLLEEGRPVVSFPIMEYWLDIGRHEDYQKAHEDVLMGRL